MVLDFTVVFTILSFVLPLQFRNPFLDELDLVTKGLSLGLQSGDSGFIAAAAFFSVTVPIVVGIVAIATVRGVVTVPRTRLFPVFVTVLLTPTAVADLAVMIVATMTTRAVMMLVRGIVSVLGVTMARTVTVAATAMGMRLPAATSVLRSMTSALDGVMMTVFVMTLFVVASSVVFVVVVFVVAVFVVAMAVVAVFVMTVFVVVLVAVFVLLRTATTLAVIGSVHRWNYIAVKYYNILKAGVIFRGITKYSPVNAPTNCGIDT